MVHLGLSACVHRDHVLRWRLGKYKSIKQLDMSSGQLLLTTEQCGMLAESKRIRQWINKTAIPITAHAEQHYSQVDAEELHPPKSQGLSLNPMPALVILLLGLMMSSHHQDSMTSTMVHSQWGMLLVGFSICRGVTYVLLYLNPPSSHLPARPPSELIASFCLISGGLVFMLSVGGIDPKEGAVY